MYMSRSMYVCMCGYLYLRLMSVLYAIYVTELENYIETFVDKTPVYPQTFALSLKVKTRLAYPSCVFKPPRYTMTQSTHKHRQCMGEQREKGVCMLQSIGH